VPPDELHRMDLTGKIKIVAFDKDPQTLDGIERKWITATVVQKPYLMAFYGVRFLDDLHHNAVHEFKDWATAPAASIATSWIPGTAVIDETNLGGFSQSPLGTSQARPLGVVRRVHTEAKSDD